MENTDQKLSSAFLILDGQAVYEIVPNSVMNIGRLESSDIVLDDYHVSREHAVLKYSGNACILVDLASTHGTFVNGERIDRRIVEFGDKIRITDHELVFSSERPSAGEGNYSFPTPKMVRSLDRRLKLFGGLNEYALITLVQFFSQEKQSGLLLLELGQNPGPRLYFQEGEITHVADGENLAELLTRQKHEPSLFFYFHHETEFPPRTIHESTPNYLIGLCQSHDESQERQITAEASARSAASLALTTRLEKPTPPE